MRSGLAIAIVVVGLTGCGEPAAESVDEPASSATPESEAPAAAIPAPTPSRGASQEPSARPSSVAIIDLSELVGEYRVAAAGGRDIDLPHGITARIDDTGVIVTSDCVILSWVWFFDEERLVTEQLFPRASCGRTLLPEEEAIVSAFNGATSVVRTPANGIEVAGENGAVLLFSQ